MEKRRYTRIMLLEEEIDEMLAQGKSHKEIENQKWKKIMKLSG